MARPAWFPDWTGQACVIVAGVYGAMTVSKRILYVQAVPAALALLVLTLAR